MARFYISSTFSDLQAYRSEVYRTLRRMEHDAVAMEDYVAADQRPLERCLADVERCSLYIGIVAWRRGFIPDRTNPHRRSITELEYAHAGECGLPRLIFLLSPAAPWPSDAKDPPPDQQQGNDSVEAFRERLANDHLVSFFETPEQLALLVSIAVRKWEIESGQSSPMPSLVDQTLPGELRIKSYIPGQQLTVRYRQRLPALLFSAIFATSWFSFLLYSLFDSMYLRPLRHAEPINWDAVTSAATLTTLFAWAGLRRSEIHFDFDEGRVTVQGLFNFSTASPVVGALTLTTAKRKAGWQATLDYGHYRLARTAAYPSQSEARDRLLQFATALNFELGMHTLPEKTIA